MRTPDGRECPYYAANYHRRATPQETCHLFSGVADGTRWHSALCARCPVPEIRRANGCPTLVLQARIGRRPWRFWERERVLIRATCSRRGQEVANPYTGCGECHTPLTFVVESPPTSGAEEGES